MRKKWSVVTGVVMLILAFAAGAFASNHIKISNYIKIIINGQEIKPDVPPQIINGRTMVPVKWIAESLGADVQLEQSSEGYTVKITSKLLERLHAIEPEQPNTIVNDWNREQIKQFLEQNTIHSIQDIRSLGCKVPFEITSEDDSWIRPIYSKAWHSTFMGGKYSDITQLISCAQRNFFIYTGGLSEGAGLYYMIGFSEDWEKPVGSSFNSSHSFELWLLSHKVKEIYRLDDEWLVVVEPQLQGYQTVRINYSDAGIMVDKETKSRIMLFRMVTPEGYELERAAEVLPVQ